MLKILLFMTMVIFCVGCGANTNPIAAPRVLAEPTKTRADVYEPNLASETEILTEKDFVDDIQNDDCTLVIRIVL